MKAKAYFKDSEIFEEIDIDDEDQFDIAVDDYKTRGVLVALCDDEWNQVGVTL
jgi:hypothetical protein